MSGFQGTSTRRDPHEALSALIEAERREVYTELPGRVVSYDAKKQTATIQPQLEQTFAGKTLKAPELIEVPVDHPRAGGFILHTNLKPNDPVTIRVPHRSQEAFNAEGGMVDGRPARMHDLSDARVTPAGHPTSKPATVPEKGIYFGTDDGKSGFTISEDGRFDFKQSGDTLLKIVADFMETMAHHTNAGLPHDQKADVLAQLARLKKLMT